MKFFTLMSLFVATMATVWSADGPETTGTAVVATATTETGLSGRVVELSRIYVSSRYDWLIGSVYADLYQPSTGITTTVRMDFGYYRPERAFYVLTINDVDVIGDKGSLPCLPACKEGWYYRNFSVSVSSTDWGDNSLRCLQGSAFYKTIRRGDPIAIVLSPGGRMVRIVVDPNDLPAGVSLSNLVLRLSNGQTVVWDSQQGAFVFWVDQNQTEVHYWLTPSWDPSVIYTSYTVSYGVVEDQDPEANAGNFVGVSFEQGIQPVDFGSSSWYAPGATWFSTMASRDGQDCLVKPFVAQVWGDFTATVGNLDGVMEIYRVAGDRQELVARGTPDRNGNISLSAPADGYNEYIVYFVGSSNVAQTFYPYFSCSGGGGKG